MSGRCGHRKAGQRILLVEPSYRSKFPPLGLMRLSTYHKDRGDQVHFVRGKDEWSRQRHWDRIYVASLFTWELPRTAETIRFYSGSVREPRDILVGGVGVTLMPDYMRGAVDCTLVEGPLDVPGKLGPGTPAIADLVPDYGLLRAVDYDYQPHDAYFARISKGCVRSCPFCAVPKLETEFGLMAPLSRQVAEAKERHGEKQHLVILDNNVLATPGIEDIIGAIRDLGFEAGARRKGRERYVDFNQGLDARLICEMPELARHLATINIWPVRLAYDFAGMRKPYEQAVRLLARQGFVEFTNYMLFNFKDTPRDLWDRLWVNARLNQELGIRISGFPMRFIPMDDVHRRHVGPGWTWRYLRGIQCVLLATHGLVSPNPQFIRNAFGETHDEFLEILAMPDRYIIYREHHRNDGAAEWKKEYARLDRSQRALLLDKLQDLNAFPRGRPERVMKIERPFQRIMQHYYPSGKTPANAPPRETSSMLTEVAAEAGT